jgi:hypothetical protein
MHSLSTERRFLDKSYLTILEQLGCLSRCRHVLGQQHSSSWTRRPTYISSRAFIRSWLISSETTESFLYAGCLTIKFRIQAAGVHSFPTTRDFSPRSRKVVRYRWPTHPVHDA